MRKPLLPSSFLIMASAMRSKTTKRGTKSPFSMTALSCLPISEPDLTSSRRRSPEDKWVNPYLATILSHWVPLPHPGPPKTQMTGRPALVKGVLSMFFLSKACKIKEYGLIDLGQGDFKFKEVLEYADHDFLFKMMLSQANLLGY